MRILVVDDEVKNAQLVAAELADAGHTTAWVGGGAAALKSLEASPVDAVVTDLRMAPPDGLALLAEIRRRWPANAVLLMTAYSSTRRRGRRSSRAPPTTSRRRAIP